MNNGLKVLAKRLAHIRATIVRELPFFGRLLLHLQLGFANCETAYTGQKRIVFDPEFANKLNDNELKFIMLHELFHCVLNHCARSKGKVNYIYNIACDIVVNSIILETLGLKSIEIAENEVMHIAPDDTEGKEHSADEVYQMLISLNDKVLKNKYGAPPIDTHIVWEQLSSDGSEKWQARIKEASKSCCNGNIPLGMKRHIEDINHNPKCNWRQLLRDYIQFNKGDYTYNTPDRRFTDIIIPSFQENIDGARGYS